MDIQIKELREKAGWSQEKMAEKMNLTQSSYARFELQKTKIDLDRVEEFAKQINRSLIEVLTYPEHYINIKDIGKELNLHNPEVIVQLKVRGNKREDILKLVFGDKDIELCEDAE
jgi:transcriptional regulator with XRE-family HTH domain